MSADKIEIIIRTEANYGGNGYHWLAVFPNDSAKPGFISCVPFEIKEGNVRTIEPFGTMTLSWYYDKTKYVKPTVLDSYGVYDAVRKWYAEDGCDVKFRQKMPSNLSERAWAWYFKKESK